jgi:hypothetical protein
VQLAAPPREAQRQVARLLEALQALEAQQAGYARQQAQLQEHDSEAWRAALVRAEERVVQHAQAQAQAARAAAQAHQHDAAGLNERVRELQARLEAFGKAQSVQVAAWRELGAAFAGGQQRALDELSREAMQALSAVREETSTGETPKKRSFQSVFSAPAPLDTERLRSSKAKVQRILLRDITNQSAAQPQQPQQAQQQQQQQQQQAARPALMVTS